MQKRSADSQLDRDVERNDRKHVRAPGRLLHFASGAKLAECILHTQSATKPLGMNRVVAEAMTIKETCFFRNPEVFRLLSERIVPEMIERNRRCRTLTIWSAGCATGQEAYSLAMLLCEKFPELADWDVRVLGTDVSRKACAYAARGRYSRFEVNRGLPVQFLLKYFERKGENWTVSARLRRMVQFRCADICRPRSQTFDLILLRHVLLCLPPQQRTRVLVGTYFAMRPESRLLLGPSEQVEEALGLFEPELIEDHCFYRSVSAG
jgi:chemotaxis protein methyltransferase CheR